MKSGTFPTKALLPLFCGVAVLGEAHGSFVLDQIGDENLYDFASDANQSPSQQFSDFPTFSSAVLEDFTVGPGELKVTEVSVILRAHAGYASFNQVNGFILNIFSDENLAGVSLVGDVANVMPALGIGATITQISGDYGLVRLGAEIFLPSAGTYWVGVSPAASLSVAGQFSIPFGGAAAPIAPGNTNAVLANPGNGFGNGVLSDLNQDYAYSVTAVPEPGSISLWALASSILLTLRRRAGNSP